MAEIDVIGGIFSKEAEKSLDNVIAKTEKAVKAIQNLNSLSSGAGNSGGGGGSKGGSKAEFDAATQAVNELVKARQKLTTAEQYDYAEVVRLRTERAKLIAQLKEEALALEGKSKAQKKAAIESEKALKEQIKLNEKATIEAKKLADEQVKANAKAAAANEKYQNKLIDLEIKKEEALKKSNARAAEIIERRIQKESEQADRRIQKELAAVEKLAQAQRRSSAKQGFAISPEQQTQGIVDKSANAEKLKLAAIAASQYTTQLQKLDAQIRLLSIDMDSKFNPELQQQSQEYRELYAQQSRLKESYQRLSRATGQMGSSSKSAYGSFFQMTQVMRELPNFAIDARIGFMALSNNLPMLADEFKAVKQQIIDTEGAAGASIKTWKSLAKSLLSLNTIMIVASTLLVLFGDDIIEIFVGKVPLAKKSLEDFYKVLGDGNNKYTDTLKIMTELDYMIKNINLKYIEERDIVEKYNSTLGVHYGKLKNVAEIKEFLNKKNQAYIDITLLQMEADERLTDAFNAQSKIRMLERNKEVGFWKKSFDVIAVMLSNDYIFGDETKRQSLMAFAISGGRTKAQRKKEADDLKKEAEDAKKLALDLRLKADKIAEKNKIDLYPNDEEKKGRGRKGRTKNYQDIDVTREYYKSEEELMRRLADLQNDITRENEQGEINSYEKRRKAAELYYNTITTMAMNEQNVAISNELASTQSKISDVNTKYKNNKKNFKSGSPEDLKNEKQYADALATIEANKNDSILKINDEYLKKELDAKKKYQKEVLGIDEEIYKEQVYYIEKEAELVESLQSALDKQDSLAATFMNKLGIGDKYKSMKNASKSRQREISATKEKLKGATGEDKDNLEKQLQNQLDKDAAQNQIDVLQITEDAKASIVENSIETLKSLWDNYYAYLEEKIDEQLDRDTKINDERLAQYEDETKAGKHTAKELDDRKKQSADYQTSLDEEAARKKAELEKQQFLLGQAMALGQVWINYAMAQPLILAAAAAAGIPTFGAGTAPYLSTMEALSLAAAIASSAAIAAQTIPAFAEGGDMLKDGKAILGDGGKHELVVDPRGNFFISDNKSGLYDLKAGSHIFPDVNRLDIEKILGLNRNSAGSSEQKLNELATLKSIERAIKTQKQGNFYGMPLVRQMNNSERYGSRKRGLIN